MSPTVGPPAARPGSPTRRTQAGQATVEVAVVLPLVALLLAAVAQAALVARDQLRVTHAAAAAARAVVVEPGRAAARRAVDDAGLDLTGRRVTVEGDLRSGGLATVAVRARPTRLPVVGWAIAGVELSERFVARVE